MYLKFIPRALNPILPFRIEYGTVIHPVGSWTGVYFSEELKNAENLGYKFEIIEGLKFAPGTPKGSRGGKRF
jgi:hypothetical protein